MTTLEIAKQYVTLQRSGTRYAGPCPKCGGSHGTNKFVVYTEKDNCHCFSCGLNGDAVTLLRELQGMSCPAAHIAAGKNCSKSDCPAWDKCRLGSRSNGGGVVVIRKKEPLNVPLPPEDQNFEPAVAVDPDHLWQQQAAALIAKAHAKLLETPEQLAYLKKRGLPLAAVKQYQLGWLPENRYPSRAAWGLPEKLRDDKKPKKLFIPSGILIPFFDATDQPHRIRIRRSEPRQSDGRYYWLDGSGNDITVIGQDSHAFVVIESDLDALMVRYQTNNLVGTIPLGSCSPKPKQWAMDVLNNALSILVALDFDHETDPGTGKYKNPGGSSAQWWIKQFPRAERWPVPAGKDPGEYYQDHAGDIRAWVLAGLPPAFHVATAKPKTVTAPALPIVPEHAKGKTINGHDYVVTYHAEDVAALQNLYPNAVVFSPHEITQLKGMSPEDSEKMLLAKKIFSAQVSVTGPVPVDYPLPPEPENNQPEPQQEELTL